jgi:hypothetical protein
MYEGPDQARQAVPCDGASADAKRFAPLLADLIDQPNIKTAIFQEAANRHAVYPKTIDILLIKFVRARIFG